MIKGRVAGGARAKDPKKAMKRLIRIVFGERKAKFVFIVVSILISAFSIVYSSNFLGQFIDESVTPLIGVKNPDWQPVIMSLVQFALIVSVSVVFNYLLSRTMVGISQDTLYDIRIKMFKKLDSLPLSYFDQNQHGTIMSRFSNDTDTLNQFISNSQQIIRTRFIGNISCRHREILRCQNHRQIFPAQNLR